MRRLPPTRTPAIAAPALASDADRGPRGCPPLDDDIPGTPAESEEGRAGARRARRVRRRSARCRRGDRVRERSRPGCLGFLLRNRARPTMMNIARAVSDESPIDIDGDARDADDDWAGRTPRWTPRRMAARMPRADPEPTGSGQAGEVSAQEPVDHPETSECPEPGPQAGPEPVVVPLGPSAPSRARPPHWPGRQEPRGAVPRPHPRGGPSPPRARGRTSLAGPVPRCDTPPTTHAPRQITIARKPTRPGDPPCGVPGPLFFPLGALGAKSDRGRAAPSPARRTISRRPPDASEGEFMKRVLITGMSGTGKIRGDPRTDRAGVSGPRSRHPGVVRVGRRRSLRPADAEPGERLGLARRSRPRALVRAERWGLVHQRLRREHGPILPPDRSRDPPLRSGRDAHGEARGAAPRRLRPCRGRAREGCHFSSLRSNRCSGNPPIARSTRGGPIRDTVDEILRLA
jgi:hypothetical protein